MWDIPSWLTTMDAMKPVLTGTGTAAVYLILGLCILSQIGVFLFGIYKVRQMFLEAED